MICACAVRIVCVVLLASGSLGAQNVAPAVRPPKGDLPPVLKQTTRALGKVFSGPLHLMVGGVASGGGLAGGLGINLNPPAPWDVKIKGLYSIRDYWVVESFARYQGRRAMVEVYGRLRDLPQVAFYGLGATSDLDQRTNFAMREDQAGVDGSFRVAPWVTLTGRAEQLWIDVSAGRANNQLSIEQVFNHCLLTFC